MVDLEAQAWPEDVQASKDKLHDRLTTFSEGFFGVFLDGQLVGMASSQVVDYEKTAPLKSWTELTADGWISRTHKPEGNCLHFVSVCVCREARGRGIGKILNQKRISLAKQLGLSYALTDTRLPGLGAYLTEQPNARAESYIEEIVARRRCEPVVNMYLSLGFDPAGLISNCMESDVESAHYGLAMLKQVK